MDFFQILAKKQETTSFQSSSEMRFFLDHCGILANYPLYGYLSKAEKSFDVVRANIVIRSIINKIMLDDAYEKAIRLLKNSNPSFNEKEETFSFKGEALELINHVRDKLPYFEEGGHKIYVPILPRIANKIYESDLAMLSKPPYRALLNKADAMFIDPFDMYGDALYDSYFTKLIFLKKTEESSAFYDIDACYIYIVTKHGRLENGIALFDKWLRHPNHNHMMGRLAPVIDAYYQKDKNLFQKQLVDNQLISSSILYRNRYEERRLSSIIRKKYSS